MEEAMATKRLHSLTDSSQQQSNNEVDDGFIPAIGRDMTIKCLIHCTRSTYPALVSVNKSIGSLIRSGEIYRLRKQKGLKDYCFYVSYGANDRWKALYDLNSSNKWMRFSGPCMPFTVLMFYFSNPLVVGTELLVNGKGVWSSGICSYSILTDTWSLLRANFKKRKFAYASDGTIAIYAGGYDTEGYKDLSSVETYNSETKIWNTLPNMNKPRSSCSAAFMDNKLYVIGGFNNAELLTCGEEFDFGTSIWTYIPNMSPIYEVASRGEDVAPLIVVVDNELYTADFDVDKDVKKYDKQTKLWTKIGDLPHEWFTKRIQKCEFKGCGHRLIVVMMVAESELFDEDDISCIKIYSWKPDEDSPNSNLLGSDRHHRFLKNFEVAVHEY